MSINLFFAVGIMRILTSLEKHFNSFDSFSLKKAVGVCRCGEVLSNFIKNKN